MRLKTETKTIDTQIWVLAIFVAFLAGISLTTGVFMTIQHTDDVNDIYCNAWEMGDIWIFDNCVQTINDKEFWVDHLFFINLSLSHDRHSDERENNCKLLESSFNVDWAECYAFVKKYPGSTGSDVVEGLKEMNHDRVNYVLSKSLN